MAKLLYDGQGDAEGKVCWTKNSGDVVGRPYVRQRTLSAFIAGVSTRCDHRKAGITLA